ncbi:MAG TPA: porin, partial [Acidobacteriota bacterium]
GFLSFFRNTELSGFVDAYYGYNFNHPAGDAPLRNFDTKHNQFSLNLAEIALEKKPTADHRLGFRVDLDFGPATEIVHASEPGGLGIYRNFQQGYVSYLAPVGKGLQIDVGKFVTQHGAEVIESKDNWNYSRSLLFALAIPYYHMGARASYSFNDKFAFAGYLVNGWNNVVDNNTGKTVGLQAVLKPNAKWSITQNYMFGPEQAKDNDDFRHLWDTTVTYTVTPQFSLMGNYDYGMDKVSGGRVHWQGFAGYARYQANKVWALSPRFEWYDDHDGFTTGVSQAVKEFTLTSEQKIANGLFTRLEYRRDFSDKGFFPRSLDRLVKAQSTVTMGVFYAFSSRGE